MDRLKKLSTRLGKTLWPIQNHTVYAVDVSGAAADAVPWYYACKLQALASNWGAIHLCVLSDLLRQGEGGSGGGGWSDDPDCAGGP